MVFSGTDADAHHRRGTRSPCRLAGTRVTVTVTAEDGVTTETYTVRVNQGVTADYGWKAVDDLDGLIKVGNGNPFGVWSDGDDHVGRRL